jgi:hypothetical protein
MNVHLLGQKFQNGNGLKRGVVNRLRNQDKIFYATSINNLLG